MGQRRLHMSDLSEDAQVYKNWWGWGDDLFFQIVCVCVNLFGVPMFLQKTLQELLNSSFSHQQGGSTFR